MINLKTVLFLSLILFSAGCRKDQVDSGRKVFLSGQVTLPTVNNGMLCFSDTAHFNNYYDFLENTMEMLDDSLTDFDFDSALYSYELNYENFLSLREDEYQLTEASSDPFAIMRNDFIGDDILKSILNSNYEVCIGGDVYVFYNQTDIYVIENGNTAIVNQFQNLTKGGEDLLIDQLNNPEVILISSKHQYSKTLGATGDLEIIPHTIISQVDCRPYQKIVKMWLSSPNIPLTQLDNWDVTWEVDYGDGNDDVWNDVSKSYIYTYQTDGPFDVTISCKYEDPNNLGQYLYSTSNFEVQTIACSSTGIIDSKWVEDQQQIDYAISALLSYSPTKGWIRSRLYAKTIAWQWHGQQAKWKRYKTDNQVSLEYNLRDRLNCNSIDVDTKSKAKKKRKTRWLYKRQQFAIYNGENVSFHEVDFPNQTLSESITLFPCP